MFPFHTWLPDAHVEAPTAGSVVLAGVLLKMGTYGFVRFAIPLFPVGATEFTPAILTLSVIGIVYGSLVAMVQGDIKKLVAYSSVAHLGFVMLGMFAFNLQGMNGSILQMINHGLSTGLLFLLVGMIYERTHTRRLDRFGGIATVMPVFSFFFVFTVLSSAGLPGLNGFVGEYMILAGTFTVSPLWTTISLGGVIFGAVYLLMATRRVLFGPLVHEENGKLLDLGGRELATLIPLVALCVWIGVAPNGFIQKTAGSLDRISHRVERAQEHMKIGRLSTAQQTVLRTEVGR
jgi:NADH-quinone oxidoreductase subunit M